MGRVFKEKASKKIRRKFEEMIRRIWDYEAIHYELCQWIIENVETSNRKKKKKKRKKKEPSFGQAAKVADYMFKVLVSHCHFPSVEEAGKIIPRLNGIIDTGVISRFRKKGRFKGVYSLSQIDITRYLELQRLLRREAAMRGMTVVEFDDVFWQIIQKKEHEVELRREFQVVHREKR